MSNSGPENKAAHHEHAFTIYVNNQPFETTAHELTGSQLKALASVPGDYELFEVRGSQTVTVTDGEEVHIHQKSEFRAIPAGTFGGF